MMYYKKTLINESFWGRYLLSIIPTRTKVLLLFVFALLPIVSKAVTGHYYIDGISYYITGASAAVNSTTEKYSGDIIIPEKVTLGGVDYKVTSIMDFAFEGCYELTSVSIPDGVRSFGRMVFSGCSKLTSVNIPSNLSIIPYRTFAGCSSLASINIPNSVTAIGEDAFAGTAWYSNQPNGLVYAGKIAYSYKGTMPENTSITFKEGTVSISSSICRKCTGLISVNIPNSVTEIGSEAFYYCKNLTTVIIGNGLTKIGSESFGFCTKGLEVFCYAVEVPFCGGNDPFTGTPTKKLHVPESSISSYKNNNTWKYFTEIVPLVDNDPKPGESNSTGIYDNILDKTNNNVYYDLHGRRHKSPQKGITIVNGKKIFIK